MSDLLVMLIQFLITQYPAESGFFAWLLTALENLFPVPTPAESQRKLSAKALPFTEQQLQQYVDADFAALLAKLTSRPLLTYFVTDLQEVTDSLLIPAFWQYLVSQGIAAKKP